MKPTRKRTQAREVAVQALYQFDALRRISGAAPGGGGERSFEEVERFIDRHSSDPEVRAFARELTRGACERIEEIDGLLAQVVSNWRVERIAAMDRAILRLAAYELSSRQDIPPKVSINEAIEIAKRYSTAQSGGFVNGVLDKLLQMRKAPGEGE